MNKKLLPTNVAVLGLGRFGMSIVQTLSDYDINIMACDKDETKLQQAAEYATHVVEVDITNENTLETLGLGNFEVVILAIGKNFEASQIAAMNAMEHGAPHVIVKASNMRQKRILETLGVNKVILPEHETGAKLARNLMRSNIMDILEESNLYAVTEMRPLDEWLDKTVQQADIRRKHNLTVLAIRHGDRLKIPVMPDTMISKDDVLITLSENKK